MQRHVTGNNKNGDLLLVACSETLLHTNVYYIHCSPIATQTRGHTGQTNLPCYRKFGSAVQYREGGDNTWPSGIASQYQKHPVLCALLENCESVDVLK